VQSIAESGDRFHLWLTFMLGKEHGERDDNIGSKQIIAMIGFGFESAISG
jgi:hypothetical protein